MRLTKRGKRVRALILALLIGGGVWVIHELQIHTRITTCRQEAEGWVCHTAWK